jgi:hypothetical protein
MDPLSSLKRVLGLDADPDEVGVDEDATRPRELAAAFVDAHPDRDLDYTPESLYVLDEIADATIATRDSSNHDAAEDDAAVADGETVDGFDESVRRMGAYLGETFVRAYDGEWRFDEYAGWVVELPATHQGQPIDLTIPSVLGDVVDGESSFAIVHDVFASELDADAPTLATEDAPEAPTDPRGEPAPADVVAAFDRVAAELAADHERLDFTPGSFDALDDVARRDREVDTTAFDPDRDDVDISVGGHTDAVAGYFAAVIRTHHTAEYRGELAETLVVEGPTRAAHLEPRAIAAAAAADETSFAELYANLREDLGLVDASQH